MSENQDDELSIAKKVPAFYANSLSVTTSGYDVSILFSRELRGEPESIKVDNLLVYMSPMLLKRFSEILVGVVQRYENAIGVIPLPPEKQAMEGDQYETDKDSE